MVETAGHPIVYAESPHVEGAPTALVYGHYDVQPIEPLEEWRTPPFEPTIIDDYLYGRGTSDDKCQLYIHIKSIEAYMKTSGRLPLNVKCLFEGEEEYGGEGISPWTRVNGPDDNPINNVYTREDPPKYRTGEGGLTALNEFVLELAKEQLMELKIF